MILDKRITIYKSVTDKVGQGATFADFLRTCYENRDNVTYLRTLSPEEADTLKKTLPAATLSGCFAPTRHTENLQEHSGLLCLDFDHIEDCGALMNLLRGMDIVCYCSRSVSGHGVFAIVQIAYPNKHKQHFESLRRYFASMGYEIDKACKDVTRLRVISYDQEAFYRPDAVTYEGVWEEPRQLHEPRQREYDSDTTEERVSRLCAKLRRYQIDITNNYADWLNIGFALADLGENGRDFFHDVSSLCSKYNRAQCDRQFTNCLNTRRTISIEYFFKVCKQEGITFKD